MAAAAAIAVGEAAPAMVGQMVCCGLSGGGKSCARQIRLLFVITILKINVNGLLIQNMTFCFFCYFCVALVIVPPLQIPGVLLTAPK